MIAFQVIGSLVLILGGLVLVLQLLKKYVPAMAGPRDLSVIEQLHLGDRCRLMVVQIRERREPMFVQLAQWPRWQRWAVYYAMVLGIVFFGKYRNAEFIYFQF